MSDFGEDGDGLGDRLLSVVFGLLFALAVIVGAVLKFLGDGEDDLP